MDKISDFLHQFKERLSSPFFSSFIIAWLLWNWRAPVVLFFDSKDWLINSGYVSYSTYLEKTIDTSHGILYPTLSALLYAFGIRNALSALDTWAINWGGRLNEKIAKGGVIRTDIFIENQENLKRVRQKYQELVEEASVFEGQRETLLSEKVELQRNVQSNVNRIKHLEESFNPSLIKGNWIFKQTSFDMALFGGNENGENVCIENSFVYRGFSDKIRLRNLPILFNITFFYFDDAREALTIILERLGEKHFFQLQKNLKGFSGLDSFNKSAELIEVKLNN